MTNQLSRRDFLKLSTALGGFALTPSWMSRLSFAPQGVEPSGDLLVVVFLRGAIDGLNAVIPMLNRAIMIYVPNSLFQNQNRAMIKAQ